MLAPGSYKARAVAGAEQFTTSSSGGEQIVIELAVQTGASSTERVKTFLAFSGNAAPLSIRRLRALGWRGDDITRLVGIDANEVTAIVKLQTYDGKTRTVVEIATPREARPLDDSAKRSFRERMRGLANADPAPDADGSPLPIEPTLERDLSPDELPF